MVSVAWKWQVIRCSCRQCSVLKSSEAFTALVARDEQPCHCPRQIRHHCMRWHHCMRVTCYAIIPSSSCAASFCASEQEGFVFATMPVWSLDSQCMLHKPSGLACLRHAAAVSLKCQSDIALHQSRHMYMHAAQARRPCMPWACCHSNSRFNHSFLTHCTCAHTTHLLLTHSFLTYLLLAIRVVIP